jgi:hypothetical protein
MKRGQVCWLWSALLLAAPSLAAAQPVPATNAAPGATVRVGMTLAEVRTILGPPQRVARQILYHRYLEQWAYLPPVSLRVEFDCPRGQAARVIATRPTSNGKRP